MGDVFAEFAARVSSHAEARAWVRARAAKSRENFSVLSVFVPRELRDDFAAVYAFCRVSDDLADETGADRAARDRSREMLAEWRAMVVETHARAMASEHAAAPERCEPSHPIMVALEGTIQRHALALRHFTDLLDAFEEDQRVTRWPSLAELTRYSKKSANPVGRLVLGLFGVHEGAAADGDVFAASDALCTALQLTNFWQDVRRDLLERDRVYVPCDELGIDARTLESWIRGAQNAAAQREFDEAMRPMHLATRELYEHGRGVVELSPRVAHRVLALFWNGGVCTLDRVVAARGAELWTRPRVGKWTKAWLVTRELLGVGRSGAARSDVARA